MIYTIFAALLVIIFQILVLLFLKNRALSAFHDFFDPQEGNTPSKFAESLDAVAQTFATRIMQSARAQISNMSSITSRQSKVVAGDAAIESLGDSPLASVAMSVPGIEKMIRKNPLLGFAAQYLMGKMSSPSNSPAPQGTGANISGAVRTDPFTL